MNTKLVKYLIPFTIFALAAIYITFPLIVHLGDYTTGLGDEMLIAWIHAWVVHALLTNPLSLFNATIYYPFQNSLAYSDIFLTGSVLTALPAYLIGQPIAATNITIISSLALLGFSIYLLSYYLTKDFFASLLPGLIVIFSPAMLSYSVHIQVLEIYWVPLSILCFLKYLDTKKSKYFLLTLLCFLLQTYNSFLPGYFILFSLVLILIFQWAEDKRHVTRIFTKQNILFLLITFLLLLPITIPYFQVSHEFQYVRDIRDSIHFAMQPEDLLYPGETTRLHDFLIKTIPTNQHSQNDEFKFGYLGVTFSMITIIAVIFILRKWKSFDWRGKSFLSISLLGLILSFGPFLHLNRMTIHHPFPIPLPYALFYYILPGFQGFRTSVRWELLFILGISIFISMVLHKIFAIYPTKVRVPIYCLLILGCIIEFNFPMKYMTAPQRKDFPKVYSWLATTPSQAAIIEMPIYNWNMTPYASQEQLRDYYNTAYFRKTMNGASGFSPPQWQNTVTELLKTFPDKKSITNLKKTGIKYIVVHKKEYDKLSANHYQVDSVKLGSGERILKTLKQNKAVSLVKQFDNDYVFSIN